MNTNENVGNKEEKKQKQKSVCLLLRNLLDAGKSKCFQYRHFSSSAYILPSTRGTITHLHRQLQHNHEKPYKASVSQSNEMNAKQTAAKQANRCPFIRTVTPYEKTTTIKTLLLEWTQ